MFKKLKKQNNKGFTLVELLVVIAIIGVLAVVAVPSLFKNINRAKATDVISYMAAARTAAVSEYAATQTAVSLDKAGIDALVSDAPSEVTGATVAIDAADGSITMTVEVPTALKGEVETQAAASFKDDTITVSAK